MQNFRLVVVAVALLFAPSAVHAQGASRRPLPRPTTSCGPTAIILVTVVNAAGKPVGDATIEVRRTSDKQMVREGEAELAASGEYVVMDDLALPLVDEKGTRFTVQVRRGKQKASVVLHVGRSSDGCHVRLASGSTRMTLR